MKNLKKYIYWLTVILVVPCLIYYSSKFYCSKSLSFEKSAILGWTIIVSLILFNIVQTFFLQRNVDALHKENKELKDIIVKNHYDNINYQKNTREIIMMGEEDIGGEE